MNDWQLGVWVTGGEADTPAPGFMRDDGTPAQSVAGMKVVSPRADLARLDYLFGADAEQVFIGESALHDGGLLRGAVKRYGGERIGVSIPVARAPASWNLDRASNADFSFVAVSNPVPRWCIATEGGTLTDVDAQWWAGEMVKAGCGDVLVHLDAPHDDDLLASAEMAELLGERYWLDAGSGEVEELRFWVRYGQVRRFLLPAGCDAVGVAEALRERLTCEVST